MDALMVEMSRKHFWMCVCASSKFAGKDTGAKCVLMGSEVSYLFAET